MTDNKDKVIKYFEKQTSYSEEKGTHLGLFVDTETTGLDHDAELWEIALLPFSFTDGGQICQVFKPYVGREEPRKPLSEEVMEICRVSPGELQGKAFDDFKVLDLFKKVEIVIAHNAKFDRPKIHRRFPMISSPTWACSAFDPDWTSRHIHTRTLDYLAFKYGFWFDHHGALADCRAGLHILAQELTPGMTVFQSLLQKAYSGSTILEVRSEFSQKDLIKNRGGYRWNPDKKIWFRVFTDEAELDKDLMFFQERGNGTIQCTTVPEDLSKRFLN